MGFVEFARDAKAVVNGVKGCAVKTTLKKGEGFTTYNFHNVKWGQIDVEETRVRIVLDLYPGQYTIEEIERRIALPVKKKGVRKTGFHLDVTAESIPPHHDVAVISLYPSYFETSSELQKALLLDFIRVAAEESEFKTDYPTKLMKHK